MSSTRERTGRGVGRVLWGRLAVAGVALLVSFWLGRASVERGVSQATFDAAQQRVAQLEQENRDIAERQVATAAGGIDTPPAEPTAADPGVAPSPAASTEATPSEAAPSEPGPAATAPAGTSYTVQENDTLQTIAERVYGDGALFPLIAEANEVDSTNLRIGDTLVIPPAPTEG